jgi:endonuclease/exonuclease/phosphatase family metal-dependent hydrolase
VCTWNVWNALNPYGWGFLGPVVLPRLESREEARLREKRQMDALLRLRQSDLDVFCLQEINPIETRRSLMAESLAMRDGAMRCNAGIKLGQIGLPLHLSEGLLILTGKAFRKRKIVRVTLSGKAYEWETPLGVPLFVQLSERRCALMLETQWRGRQITIVNLHIHHGSESVRGNQIRRQEELARLARCLKRRAKDRDLLVVCGDFNSDANSPVVEPLLDLGLVDCATLTRKKQKVTWDPKRNPLIHTLTGWEERSHTFDRIYVQSKAPLQKITLQRVLDEPMLSDHYGVLAEITF